MSDGPFQLNCYISSKLFISVNKTSQIHFVSVMDEVEKEKIGSRRNMLQVR